MRNDLHVTGIRLKKLSYLEKRLLIRTIFVLIDVKTERLIPCEQRLHFRGMKWRAKMQPLLAG